MIGGYAGEWLEVKNEKIVSSVKDL